MTGKKKNMKYTKHFIPRETATNALLHMVCPLCNLYCS